MRASLFVGALLLASLAGAASQPADVSSWMLARVVDADPTVRLGAVLDLSVALGSELAVTTLASVALTDPDPVVREEALRGLGQIGGEVEMSVLTQALWDPAPAVRGAAIDAIGAIGGESGTAALALALLDRDPTLREDAVYALGRIGGARAMELVAQVLGDVDPSVRASAGQTLRELHHEEALTTTGGSR